MSLTVLSSLSNILEIYRFSKSQNGKFPQKIEEALKYFSDSLPVVKFVSLLFFLIFSEFLLVELVCCNC